MDNIEVFPLDEDDPVYIVRGDVNGDGVLTPADIVCLVGYLIGQESDDFNAKQVDIDRSGEITITDLVLDIDLVLMAQNAASAPAIRRQSPAEQRLVLNAFEAHLGETSTVRVQLLPVEEADEDVRYTACSFVVCLPEGMTLDDVTLSSARSTHPVAMSRLDERHTRVLLYSDANAPLPLGDMVRLAVRPESVLKTNERLVVLNDVLLTTADGDDHRVHAATTTFDLGTAEILKGAQGATYGSGAIGAVLFALSAAASAEPAPTIVCISSLPAPPPLPSPQASTSSTTPRSSSTDETKSEK